MKLADLLVSGCNEIVTCSGKIPKRKSKLQDLGVIKGGCIASFKGRIVYLGDEENFKRKFMLQEDGLHLDARGLVALPGFVDSHTHLPFAGTREDEFLLRLKGLTYTQIAEKGLGIHSTVRATRKTAREELISLCLKRLDSMLLHGTTTVEAKSGYGLNLEDEIKQLEVLQEVNKIHPVDIIPTFMGAHEIAPEYKGRKSDYIQLLIEKILPEIRRLKLAEFFDVFCEEGVFSIEETRLLLKSAKKLGFKIRIHADEFSSLGGAQLAVQEGALSADHLLAISKEGIEAISESETVATLLPTVPFFLMEEKKAPARALIEKGAIVALASDFNPGSSMIESMLFVLQLAVFTLRMSVEEAINASTANAAYALRRHEEVGSLELGKKMDLVLFDIPNYIFLAYHPGVNPVRYVIKSGKIVVKEGRIST